MAMRIKSIPLLREPPSCPENYRRSLGDGAFDKPIPVLSGALMWSRLIILQQNIDPFIGQSSGSIERSRKYLMMI
jgi:hypothetical protein